MIRLQASDDVAAALERCFRALGATGGTCDATELQGEYALTRDPFIVAEGPIHLLVGDTTFQLDTGLALPSGTNLEGRAGKSRLVPKPGGAFYLLRAVNVADVTITGLDIDGQREHSIHKTVLIYLEGARNVRISGNTLRNARLQAIMVTQGEKPSTHNTIVNNVIDTYGTGETGDGIALFRGAHKNTVAGNVIRNGLQGTDAILVDDASTGSKDSSPSNDNRLIGNRLENPWYGVVVDGSSGTLIEGNFISASRAAGILLESGNGLGFAVAPSNTQVLGNSIVDQRGLAAIAFNGRGLEIRWNRIARSREGARGIVLLPEGGGASSENVAICANVVSSPVEPRGAAIRLAPTVASHVRVEYNLLTDSGESAIAATGTGTDWLIAENVIKRPRGEGVSFEGAVDRLILRGNSIDDPGGGGDGCNGMLIAQTLGELVVLGNAVRDGRAPESRRLGWGFRYTVVRPTPARNLVQGAMYGDVY